MLQHWPVTERLKIQPRNLDFPFANLHRQSDSVFLFHEPLRASFKAREVRGTREGQERQNHEGAGDECHCGGSFISTFTLTEKHKNGTKGFPLISFYLTATGFVDTSVQRRIGFSTNNFCLPFPTGFCGLFATWWCRTDPRELRQPGQTTRTWCRYSLKQD